MISGRLVVGGMLLAVIALFASSYIPAKVFLLDPLNDWQKIA